MAAGIGPRSLRQRMILTGLVWLLAALALSALMIRLAFLDSIERSAQHRLLASLRSVLAVMELSSDGQIHLSHALGDPRFDQPLSGWYWQITDEAGPALRSRSLWDAALPVRPPPGDTAATLYGRATGPRGEDLLTAERDIELTEPARRPLHVTVAMPGSELQADIQDFDQVLLLSFAALAGALGLGMVFQITFGLRPVTALAEELLQMGRDPDRRLNGSYPAEIAPLTNALNQVMDHDRRLVERAKTHVGNLAHGLKTPLAVMRAELHDPAPDPNVLGQQAERMQRLIDHHLTQARIQAATARLSQVHTPLASVIRTILHTLHRLAAMRQVELVAQCPDCVTTALSAEDVGEVVGNLLENACKWAKSRCVLRLETGTDGSRCLVVEDDGPGLEPGQAEMMLQRGERLDERSPGHGLGLSIAQQVLAAHDGWMELDRSPLGGLLVRLHMPIMDGDLSP